MDGMTSAPTIVRARLEQNEQSEVDHHLVPLTRLELPDVCR